MGLTLDSPFREVVGFGSKNNSMGDRLGPQKSGLYRGVVNPERWSVREVLLYLAVFYRCAVVVSCRSHSNLLVFNTTPLMFSSQCYIEYDTMHLAGWPFGKIAAWLPVQKVVGSIPNRVNMLYPWIM